MRQMCPRISAINLVLLVAGDVCPSGAVAQGVPTARPLAPPSAEWSRGFTSITSVRELDGGRTLVADRGENRLYVVNSETGAVDEILRPGDGPGEYRTIGLLYAIGDNETLLTDDGRSRWILLRDTDPAHTFTSDAPLNRRFRSRLDGVAVGGAVLGSVSRESPGNLGADQRILELAPGLGPHRELPRLDTISFVGGNGRYQLACVLAGSRGAPVCRFLETEDQAILFPDGWIAVALYDSYRVDWRSPDGDWIRSETLDGAVPVSEAEKCAALHGWAEDDDGCDATAVGRYAWPETVPPFLANSKLCQACGRLVAGGAPWLFADPRGRLVVRRTPQLSRRENLYDVVDRTGQLVERVILPHGEAIVGFGESSAYTIRVDEFDLQWLRRHPWRE